MKNTIKPKYALKEIAMLLALGYYPEYISLKDPVLNTLTTTLIFTPPGIKEAERQAMGFEKSPSPKTEMDVELPIAGPANPDERFEGLDGEWEDTSFLETDIIVIGDIPGGA